MLVYYARYEKMGEIIYFCYNGKMKRRYKGNMFEKIVQEIQD